MTDEERLSQWLTKFFSVAGSLVGVAFLTVIVVGIGSCVENDRNRTAACMAVGGAASLSRCTTGEQIPTANWRTKE